MSTLPDQHSSSLVTITRSGGTLLIKPTGPSVGQREAPIIQEEVKPYVEAMGTDLDHLVLDMSTTTFMSSMGLGMCIALRNSASAAKGDAILFYSQKPDGSLDDASLHGACPVLKGKKMVANIWAWNRNAVYR